MQGVSWCQTGLKFSWEADECKPLGRALTLTPFQKQRPDNGVSSNRGLHSSTSQLNLSHVSNQKTPYTPPDIPLVRDTRPPRAPPIPYEVLKLS